MAELSHTGHDVQCPLCEGHGHFRRADLLSRLSDPHFMDNVSRWRKAILEDDHSGDEQPVCAGAESFDQKVRSWPSHEFLWKRSPKE